MKGMVTNMWAYESVFYQIYPMGFCGVPLKMTEYRDMRSNVWRTGSPICRSWE